MDIFAGAGHDDGDILRRGLSPLACAASAAPTPAALLSLRAACPCAGCDAAALRLAQGLPTDGNFLARCSAGAEDGGEAAAVTLVPASRTRGALLLGSIHGAEHTALQREMLGGAGVGLYVQCALEHTGRLRARCAAQGARLLEPTFPGCPPALLKLGPSREGGGDRASDLLARLRAGLGEGAAGGGGPTPLQAMEDARGAGQHVLISCAMGRSRSVATALAHLVCGSECMPLAQAFALVRRARRRAAPNAGFWLQLMRLERQQGRGCSVEAGALVAAVERQWGDAELGKEVGAAVRSYVHGPGAGAACQCSMV